MGNQLHRGSKQVERPYEKAERFQALFYQSLLHRGKEILDQVGPDDKVMVIVGRPYNSCDSGVNLEIPKKLRDLGVLSIPMDFLPLESVAPSEEIREMYWRYGQRILAAGKIVREDPRLHAVYITNFGCGPDSFISHFFRDFRKENLISNSKSTSTAPMPARSPDAKPSWTASRARRPRRLCPARKGRQRQTGPRRSIFPACATILMPWQPRLRPAASRQKSFPESDEETLYWGRKLTSGKECYPCIVTTGDMVKLVKDPRFDHERAAFFMPSGNGPCRFGQYHRFHRIVLDDLGFEHVPDLLPQSG